MYLYPNCCFILSVLVVVDVVLIIFKPVEWPVGKFALLKGPFIWWSSLCSKTGFEHTVLTLCVRVLSTLYLTDRLCWL